MHNAKTLALYMLLTKAIHGGGLVRSLKVEDGYLVVDTIFQNKDNDFISVTLGDVEGYSEDPEDLMDSMLEEARKQFMVSS